jgi:hypothetical protein
LISGASVGALMVSFETLHRQLGLVVSYAGNWVMTE